MKVNNVDVNKFKTIKSFVLVACLAGMMVLSGCGNINQGEQLSTNNSSIEEQQEEKTYEAELIYYNSEEIKEYDRITAIYKNEENANVIHAGLTVYPQDEKASIDMPVSKYYVVSKECGVAEINLDEDEKAIISVDYSTKKISVEEVKIEKGKQK